MQDFLELWEEERKALLSGDIWEVTTNLDGIARHVTELGGVGGQVYLVESLPR